MNVSITAPVLSPGHQMFLQRLMARHVLSHGEAQDLFQELKQQEEKQQQQHAVGADSDAPHWTTLEDLFRLINQQLMAGFGLEIATVVMPTKKNKISIDANHAGQKYHAVMNPSSSAAAATTTTNGGGGGDVVAKESFKQVLPPKEREYILKILQFIMEDNDDGSASRMDLINVRTGLDEKYSLTIEEAEHCLDRLHSHGWLISNNNNNNNNTCNDDAPSQTNRRHRKSLKTTFYAIGPRSYLELRHVLQNFGLDDPPQSIYHRAL